MSLPITWGSVYSNTLPFLEFLADNILHLHYLFEIAKIKPKKSLEVGCGTASHVIFLSSFFAKDYICCLDNDKRVLNVAKKNAHRYRAKTVTFVHGDAFNLKNIFRFKFFDVAFSQGLLEHFSKSEIRELIQEQLYVAHAVVISVPSDYYPGEGIMGARRISRREWEEILKVFINDAYTIRFKNQIDFSIRTRFLAAKRGIPFFFKPMHYLIIIKERGITA